MRQPSHRRRSKRLLKLLKDLQEDDYTITAPTLLAAKHLLQHHHRCNLIKVKVDSAAANSPFETHRNLVPKFIVSQLEEQKLTDRCSETVLVPPLVTFIVLSLPSLSARDKGHPTLFRWYCPLRRRTYYVFAYIKHEMARRTYTLTELLGLRGSAISDGIFALTDNPEFGASWSPPRSFSIRRLTEIMQSTSFAGLVTSPLPRLANRGPPGTRTIRR